MDTAIIYASKHGTTAKVADKIARQIEEGNVKIFDLGTDKITDLHSFDTVILGTAIYAGTPMKAMRRFCENHRNLLLEKNLGLFVCGMEPDESKQQQETENAYARELRDKAFAVQFLGGEFLFETMNFLEKMIIKKIAKTGINISAIKDAGITKFVQDMTR
jgi:menaquinone-dependent protoporphyrinogen oxidase